MAVTQVKAHPEHFTELSILARVVRAVVIGIARPSADVPEADEHSDLLVAREI